MQHGRNENKLHPIILNGLTFTCVSTTDSEISEIELDAR